MSNGKSACSSDMGGENNRKIVSLIWDENLIK